MCRSFAIARAVCGMYFNSIVYQSAHDDIDGRQVDAQQSCFSGYRIGQLYVYVN